MRTELSGYDSPDSIFHVYRIYFFIVAVSYFVLLFDWVSNLRNEYSMVIRPSTTGESKKYLSFKPVFLASRYLTLGWCTFVVATWASASNNHSVCNWFQHYPYIYSIVALPAHLLMILRIHSIYGRPHKLLGILMGLALVDFIIQMAVNHLATSVLLVNSNPNFAICFTYPTTAVFCLVFLSPTIFHHVLLGLTLWKSVKHIRTSQSVGITPILQVIQRDHILYTLAICLVNFTNFVLVLQPNAWPYKLIMQLPALVFTQIFLSRMVFSLKKTQISTLASTSNLYSSGANSGPESGASPLSSGNEEKSGGTDSTPVVASRKNSTTETAKDPPRSPSRRKASGPYTQSRRPSGDDASLAPTYQSHRRGSSTTLTPSPYVSSDYKFPANSAAPRASEVIPPVPVSTLPIQSFTSSPTRYQNYRIPHRTMPGGRFRRQTQSRDSDTVEDTLKNVPPTEADDGHQSEAGDRVLEIRSSYSQQQAVYPYLFEPPGTAASSLPPPTATSDVANRSSGEFEYPDEATFLAARAAAASAVAVPKAGTAGTDTVSPRQSYHTPSSSVVATPALEER